MLVSIHDLARQNRRKPDRARPGRADALAIVAEEFAETLKLAVPLALTQLGQIAMMTTDLAFIGRLGSDMVAAAALAHTVFFVIFTFGLGLMSAVAPLAAQAFGARDPRMVRRALRVGLWAAVLISAAAHDPAVPRRGDPDRARPGADAPHSLRSNICSASPGASCRRCGSSRYAAS